MQQKVYYEKIEKNFYRNKMTIAKKGSTDYKELHRSYVEIQNKLKAVEEKVKINDTEFN